MTTSFAGTAGTVSIPSNLIAPASVIDPLDDDLPASLSSRLVRFASTPPSFCATPWTAFALLVGRRIHEPSTQALAAGDAATLKNCRSAGDRVAATGGTVERSSGGTEAEASRGKPAPATTKPNTPAPIGASTSAGKREAAASNLLRSQSAKKAAILRHQRDQLFDEAAKGMVPEHPQKQPGDPLKQWWPQIKRKVREGYSARQIHTMMQSPKIGLNVTVRSLKQFIEQHAKAQSAAPSAK